MVKFNQHIFILLGFSVLLLATGCSTQKNSVVNRTYHNITARYNGYFNAKESVKEGEASLVSSHEEDYTSILPIFIYGDDAASRSVYPQMDRAIEKCSKVIHNHSMYIRKKEYCKWIDDSYFLIGVSNFYKKDFEKSIEMLTYVDREFKKDPIRFDARLWLARTHIENGEFGRANSYLNTCETDKEFPEKKIAELQSIRADYFLKQGIYESAIRSLKKAIESSKRRKQKLRLTFILAQIYQQQGNSSQAIEYYTKALDLNPPYEMAFYSNINSALAYRDGSGNSGQIKEKLKKMLKDEKNIEFFDQIYYALAELELKKGNKEKGIEYLEQSYASSTINTSQKALSFTRLAELYFDEKNYVPAQAYYDSAIGLIDQSHEGFHEMLNRKNSLTDLVNHIHVVEKEDSLQALAALSPKEQEKIVNKLIQHIIDEEERIQQEQENEDFNAVQAPAPQQAFGVGTGEWYFYNPTTISFGEKEFKRKWGNRKLEDNWRRKNKSSIENSDYDEESVELEEEEAASDDDLKSPEYYLNKIPTTEKKLAISNDNIIEALYQMGIVYKERLGNNIEAIKTFEELITRFDSSRYHLISYYQLYRLNIKEGDRAKVDHYKNLILSQYPNSKYAQLIKDPNYLEKENDKNAQASQFYGKTYQSFQQRRYQQTIANCNKADTLFLDSDLIPKFHYLKALAIGKTGEISKYETALQEVVSAHAETEEAKAAQSTLDFIATSRDKKTGEEGTTSEENSLYHFKADSKHTFVIVLPGSGLDLNKAKFEVSDFNKKYFRNDNLKITSTMLGKKRLILVKSFSNIFKGMDYYESFNENKDILVKLTKALSTCFIISSENYPAFYKEKNVESYQSFFDENYK